MKKLSFFALALTLTFFVACKGKDAADPADGEGIEEVAGSASDSISNSATEELTPEEDVFAVDLED